MTPICVGDDVYFLVGNGDAEVLSNGVLVIVGLSVRCEFGDADDGLSVDVNLSSLKLVGASEFFLLGNDEIFVLGDGDTLLDLVGVVMVDGENDVGTLDGSSVTPDKLVGVDVLVDNGGRNILSDGLAENDRLIDGNCDGFEEEEELILGFDVTVSAGEILLGLGFISDGE